MTIKERYTLCYQLARLMWDCGKCRDFYAMMEIYREVPLSDRTLFLLAERSVFHARGSYYD